MTRYLAFGMVLDSGIDLPELPTADPDATPDVVVTRGTVDRPPGDGTARRRSPDEHVLCHEVATVLVAAGRRIVLDAAPEAPDEVLRHLLVGPALNHLLHQRGYFVLHAGVVAVDGHAVAFVGPSGVGKTTTAAAFLAAGHRIVSDDVAAIDTEGHTVRPGYPSIKLHPATLDRVAPPVGSPIRPSDARTRHFHPVEAWRPDPVPLARVYRLTDGDTVQIDDPPPGERLATLAEQTYTGQTVAPDGGVERNFRRCGTLSKRVPVRWLERPRRFDALPRVVERVRADLGGRR